MFQSTRPRGVRREVYQAGQDGAVSIHAPARGATKIEPIGEVHGCFNPRARAGCDQN